MELARGTRLLCGEDAKLRRSILNTLIDFAERDGFSEIFLPSVEPQSIYVNKAGEEILEQMYTFKDKGDRDLCLRPEGTATVQTMIGREFRTNDTKLWYETRCWRYERPQAGRYREFTQFGVEIVNPTRDYTDYLIGIGEMMVEEFTSDYETWRDVGRGFSYYSGPGFTIECGALGAEGQVLGGGSYDKGIGFAIGVDRLMLV